MSMRASRSPSRSAKGSAIAARSTVAKTAGGNPDEVRPATREETFPFALAAVFLSVIAFLLCFSRGYLLLYGDAVAHLGIARRILDSRNPGLIQLGGVWLPLPHLLMLPFVQKLEWWQNGLAGALPSLACYIASVAGFYRLARRLLMPRWAVAATAFYALNPNLLYLATTAMTEPLFPGASNLDDAVYAGMRRRHPCRSSGYRRSTSDSDRSLYYGGGLHSLRRVDTWRDCLVRH